MIPDGPVRTGSRLSEGQASELDQVHRHRLGFTLSRGFKGLESMTLADKPRLCDPRDKRDQELTERTGQGPCSLNVSWPCSLAVL